MRLNDSVVELDTELFDDGVVTVTLVVGRLKDSVVELEIELFDGVVVTVTLVVVEVVGRLKDSVVELEPGDEVVLDFELLWLAVVEEDTLAVVDLDPVVEEP